MSGTNIKDILTEFFVDWAQELQEFDLKGRPRLGRKPKQIKWTAEKIGAAHLIDDLKAPEQGISVRGRGISTLHNRIAEALQEKGIDVDADSLTGFINNGDTTVGCVITNIRRKLGDGGAGLALPHDARQRWHFRETNVLGSRPVMRKARQERSALVL